MQGYSNQDGARHDQDPNEIFALSFVPMPNIITWTSGTISKLKS